jgi:hypothetical protein
VNLVISDQQLYKLAIGSQKKGSTLKLELKQVLMNVTHPLPAQITQDTEPAYEFLGNAHLLSPYATEQEQTLFTYFY